MFGSFLIRFFAQRSTGESPKIPRRGKLPRSGKSEGFSVLELLVVIAVVGLVVAIGAPSFLVQLKKARLESAAQDIANVFQQTRMRAIRDNTEYTITTAGESVFGQGVIGPLELEIIEDPVGLYTGTGCPAGPTIVYDGSGVADTTSAICVADDVGNILQVILLFTAGQPVIRKFQFAGDGPGGGSGFFEKPSAATAGQSWVWY